METLTVPPEIDTPPATPNLLQAFAERHVPMDGKSGTLAQLVAYCPHKDMLTNENLTADQLTKVNDFVVNMANKLGWDDVPQEFESIFTESLTRQGVEPNIGFWSANQPQPPSREPQAMKTRESTISYTDVIAEIDKGSDGAKTKPNSTPVSTVHQIENAVKPVTVISKDHEPTSVAARRLPAESIHAIVSQLSRANETQARAAEILHPPLLKKSVEKDKIATKKATIVANKPAKKPLILDRLKPIENRSAPKKPAEKIEPAVINTQPIKVIPVPPVETKPARSILENRAKAAEITTDEEPSVPDVQPAKQVDDEVTHEIFSEAGPVHYAEAPQSDTTSIFESLLDNETCPVEPTRVFDSYTAESDFSETPMPFSVQLEQFVQQEVAAADRQPALRAIAEVQDMVTALLAAEPKVTETVADMVGAVELGDISAELQIVELAAELPISTELQESVVSMLRIMGIAEPTDQQVKQCIMKFKVEAITMQLQEMQVASVDDILHEKHFAPAVRSVIQILRDSLHKPLGQLVVQHS